MIVDTSVWIEHFRVENPMLGERLEEGTVLVHRFVLGELMLGSLSVGVVAWLRELPAAAIASQEEVEHLVVSRGLSGSGIGWVDAHLLASALISGEPLVTSDRRLATLAADLAD